jgi:hypothetical protein
MFGIFLTWYCLSFIISGMDQNSEECTKKIRTVNLDKLIDDFSQIEKVWTTGEQRAREKQKRFLSRRNWEEREIHLKLKVN